MAIPNAYTWSIKDTVSDSMTEWFLADASAQGWVYMVSNKLDVWIYDLATENATKLSDITAVLMDSLDAGLGAVLMYRPAEHEGNAYGSLYFMQGDSNRNFAKGVITSSDGQSITWGARLDTAFTQDTDGNGAYDRVNDLIYYAPAAGTNLWIYNPVTDTWWQSSTAPTVGWYRPGLTTDDDGKLYIVNEDNDDKELFSYTGSWANLTALLSTAPHAISGHKILTWFRDRLWFINWYFLGVTWIDYLDPSTGVWSYVAKANVRGQAVATTQWAGEIEHFVLKTRNFSSSVYEGVPSIKLMERTAAVQGRHAIDGKVAIDTPWRIQRFAAVTGKASIDGLATCRGKALIDGATALYGQGHLKLNRKIVVWSAEHKEIDRTVATRGKHTIDRNAAVRGRHYEDRHIILSTKPSIYPNFKLYKEHFEVGSLTQYTEERGTPIFYNEIVIQYNGTSDGEMTSALTLQSVLSVNFYGEVVQRVLECPYIRDQALALAMGKEYLEQAHVIPLELKVDCFRPLPGIQTMDVVELESWPTGISEDGWFRNLICFVQRVSKDTTKNVTRLDLITRDYMHLPVLVQTVQVNDTGAFGGTINVSSFAQSRAFTIVSNSPGSPPIVGAKVTIVQTGETKVTDSSGQVVFDLLPGRYRLLIEGAGYKGASFEVVVA